MLSVPVQLVFVFSFCLAANLAFSCENFTSLSYFVFLSVNKNTQNTLCQYLNITLTRHLLPYRLSLHSDTKPSSPSTPLPYSLSVHPSLCYLQTWGRRSTRSPLERKCRWSRKCCCSVARRKASRLLRWDKVDARHLANVLLLKLIVPSVYRLHIYIAFLWKCVFLYAAAT